MRAAGGFTLLFGLGLFAGIAYALTRKEEAGASVPAVLDPQGRPLLPVGRRVFIKPGRLGSDPRVVPRLGPWLIAVARRSPLPSELPLSAETNPSGGFYELHSMTSDGKDAGIGTPVAHVYGSEIIPEPTSEPLVLSPIREASEPLIRETDLVRAVVPISIPSLDGNLTIDEIDAIAYALTREEDPRLLLQFADTFFPSHIIAASLLMAKAKLLSFPQDTQLQALIEDAVRRPVDLFALSRALLPQFPQASEILFARASLKGAS